MEEAAINIITPVIESSVIVAGEYMKSCKRTLLTSKDMEYALKYCSRNVLGKHLGTLFPDLESDSDSDEDSEEDSLEEDLEDEESEPFTRYTGDDQIMIKVNECYDTWEMWDPESPAEIMLKNAIDKNII
jgi:hypothetical protein